MPHTGAHPSAMRTARQADHERAPVHQTRISRIGAGSGELQVRHVLTVEEIQTKESGVSTMPGYRNAPESRAKPIPAHLYRSPIRAGAAQSGNQSTTPIDPRARKQKKPHPLLIRSLLAWGSDKTRLHPTISNSTAHRQRCSSISERRRSAFEREAPDDNGGDLVNPTKPA